jgi:hypothetical protein
MFKSRHCADLYASDEHVVSHHIMWRTEIIPDPKTETDTYDNIFTNGIINMVYTFKTLPYHKNRPGTPAPLQCLSILHQHGIRGRLQRWPFNQVVLQSTRVVCSQIGIRTSDICPIVNGVCLRGCTNYPDANIRVLTYQLACL